MQSNAILRYVARKHNLCEGSLFIHCNVLDGGGWSVKLVSLVLQHRISRLSFILQQFLKCIFFISEKTEYY